MNSYAPMKNTRQKMNPRDKPFSVSRLLRDIPSRIMSPEQLEQERRFSMETKARRSEISREYKAHRMTNASLKARKVQAQKHPVVDGKATLKMCADVEVDQLCCQYNEDFSLFASGGADGIVRLYDSENYNFLRKIQGGKDTEGFTSCVTSIKHKPMSKPENIDNNFIFTYVNGVVKCFNYNTSECSFTIKENRQTYGLAFHPRMPKFVTYGDDLKIYLYDYETQVRERTFKSSGTINQHDGHNSRVFAARFNPASNAEFISGGWDNTVMLWDLRRPNGIRYISDVNICGEGLDIDRMGRKILTCSWRKENQLQLWDYSTFKLISVINSDDYTSKLYCGRFLGPELIVCGGGDPSILRVVEKRSGKSAVRITNLPYDVFHVTVGKLKYPSKLDNIGKKGRMSMMESDDGPFEPVDLSTAPNILFVAGGKIYQVDFLPTTTLN